MYETSTARFNPRIVSVWTISGDAILVLQEIDVSYIIQSDLEDFGDSCFI